MTKSSRLDGRNQIGQTVIDAYGEDVATYSAIRTFGHNLGRTAETILEDVFL
jgi:hypothetical protein